MTFKRIAVSLCTIMICMLMFISGYSKTIAIYSYADSLLDEWQNVTTTDEMAEAFRYYCKSRDLTIDGSIANAVTTFTTRTFNGLCNFLGVDMTAIQANLKYNVDSNGVKRFLFSNDIISTYNRIFAQFLQDNDLSVGDTADQQNNTLYDGHYWTCGNYTSLCYEFNVLSSNTSITKFGTPFAYDVDRLKSVTPSQGTTSSVTIQFDDTGNRTKTWSIQQYKQSGINYWLFNNYTRPQESLNGNYIFARSDNVETYAIPVIIYSNGNYYWGRYYTTNNGLNGRFQEGGIGTKYQLTPTNNTYGDTIIFLTTNNNVINNNNYEGDTIINNYGTPSSPTPNDPEYDPYPDGGGTTTDPSNTGGGSGEDDGVITFPDFDFHLPEIDWSIGDLSEKFPFSIPFDLIAFFTVLNAEPQAPQIDADIPLGSWYTWHFEADFSQFDNYAVIIRNVEFIGFCVALIYLTIRLVKG